MPNDAGIDTRLSGELDIASQPAAGSDPCPAGEPTTDEQALVRQAMRELSLSRTAFAQRLEVDPQTVWRWLKGESAPRAKVLEKIRELLARQQGFDDSFRGENAVRSVSHLSEQEWQATEIWIVKANHRLKAAEFPEIRDDMYRNIASRIAARRAPSDGVEIEPLDVYFVTTNHDSANSLRSEIDRALEDRDLFRTDLSLAKVLTILQQTIFPDVAFKDAERFVADFAVSSASKEFDVSFEEFKKHVHIYALSDIWEFVSLSLNGLFGTSFVYLVYTNAYSEQHSKRFDVFIENDMHKYVACPNPGQVADRQAYWIELPSEDARMHVQSVRPMLEHIHARIRAAEDAEADAPRPRSVAR